MSEKFLKSITFPDLSDKYVIADESLSESGAAADAKVVGDTKANIDGYYDGMTVGTAEQLVATTFTEDDAPYNFRTAGGAIDIGDRKQVEGIVGGTVAWNQLCKGSFENISASPWNVYNSNYASASMEDGIAIVTINATPTNVNDTMYHDNFYRNAAIIGHKYLVMAKIWSSVDARMSLNNANYGAVSEKAISANTWVDFAAIAGAGRTTMYTSVSINSYSTATVGQTYKIKNAMLFDLTQMFGSTIADYIYALETANAGAGVAWFKKLFPKPYYAYNAGELMSVKALRHITRGFNAWDEEWEVGAYSSVGGDKVSSSGRIRSKNMIPVIAGATYYIKAPNSLQIYRYDADGNYIDWISNTQNQTRTFGDNVHFITFNAAANSGETYNHDICINLSWDGERDGEYEEYSEHVYELDSDLELRGIPKLTAGNDLYYDGDIYEPDGTVTRKYKEIDAPTTWGLNAVDENWWLLSKTIDDAIDFNSNQDTVQRITSNKLVGMSSQSILSSTKSNLSIAIISSHRFYLVASKSQFPTQADVEAWIANNNVKLVYELAEPTEETADPYNGTQIVDDFGTEEFVDAGVAGSTRDVSIPVGHNSLYQPNLRAKLEMAPNSPDGDGDYIVRQTNGENEYVELVIPNELPTMPTEDGTYRLKVTVSNGTATLAWEAQS